MTKLRLLDLFSGIGGFSLGLERSGGFETVAFCEIDPFCRRVLAKHWPKVPQYDDIRQLTAERLAADGIAVDAICGGFPCQDISVAGNGAGLDGERSGLWFEYKRLVSELRPKFIIVENVAELLNRGMGTVLATLSSIGYDAEWHTLRSTEVGVPQRRPRVWIIAYRSQQYRGTIFHKNSQHVESFRSWFYANGSIIPNLNNESGGACSLSVLGNIEWPEIPHRERSGNNERLSVGVDRYRALGNTVTPQIPELIGRAIMEAMQ